MLKKYYLGRFFWVPILYKWYQNTSGFEADKVRKNNTADQMMYVLCRDEM